MTDITIEQFVGNQTRIVQLQHWLRTFGSQTKKCVLLHGPPGVGKTLLVRLLCHKLHIELFEADLDTRATFEHSVLNVRSGQSRLDGTLRRTAILVDAADTTSGVVISALLRHMRTTTVPVFFTAATTKLVNSDRKYVHMLLMSKIDTRDVLKFITTMNVNKRFAHDARVLRDIANASDGDLRYALLALRFANVEHKDNPKQSAIVMQRMFDGHHTPLNVMTDTCFGYERNILQREYLNRYCDLSPRSKLRHNACDWTTQLTAPYEPRIQSMAAHPKAWVQQQQQPCANTNRIQEMDDIAFMADGIAEQTIFAKNSRHSKTADLNLASVALTTARFSRLWRNHLERQRRQKRTRRVCPIVASAVHPPDTSLRQTTLDAWCQRRPCKIQKSG